MAMKEHLILPSAPELELPYQMYFSVILSSLFWRGYYFWGGITLGGGGITFGGVFLFLGESYLSARDTVSVF